MGEAVGNRGAGPHGNAELEGDDPGDELLKLNRERLIQVILFAANHDCFLVVYAAFNAAEANFANIARHNAQQEKR